DFTGRARQQPFSLVIGNADHHTRLRTPDRAKPFTPTWVRTVGDIGTRERGDGHRAFTLAVDLHKARPHDGDRRFDIRDVHGTAAIDDRANAVAIRTFDVCPLDEPAHHGWGSKHRNVA